jgi:hypothetical protein
MPTERPGKLPVSRKAIAAIVVAAFPFCLWLIESGGRNYPPEYALGLLLLVLLSSGLLAVSAVVDINRGKCRGAGIAGVVIVLAVGWALPSLQLLHPIGWIGYYRVQLGMSEEEISVILGTPARNWRRVRHVGGITSPGTEAMALAESGLPLADLLQAEPKEDRDSEAVVFRLRDGFDDGRAKRTVSIRQWWEFARNRRCV